MSEETERRGVYTKAQSAELLLAAGRDFGPGSEAREADSRVDGCCLQ